jgi:diguanylate cyclase (GGDEF)-like protein/PAS domain S-box-containing protein
MLQMDPSSGVIVEANRAAVQFYGYERAQLVGMDIAQINVLAPEEVKEERLRALREERTYFNFRHRLATGEIRDVEVYSTPVHVDAKPILFSIVHDIADRKRAERSLRDSEERFCSTYEQAAIGIVHCTFEGVILRCNRLFAEILGYSPEELAGLSIEQITEPEDVEISYENLRKIRRGEAQTVRFDKRYRRKDGRSTWARMTVSIQRDGEGVPLHFMAFAEGIDSQMEAAQSLAATTAALRDSEEQYRSTFEQAGIGIAHCSFEGINLRCNRYFAEMLGYELEEVCGKHFAELTAEEDLAISLDARLHVTIGKQRTAKVEKRYRCKDGSLLWCKESISTQKDGQGKPVHLLVFVEDIHEQKEAKRRLAAATEALWASEVHYRTTFQTSIDAIAINRMSDGMYVDVNNAFMDVLGYKRAEVMGHSSVELKIWADPDDRRKMIETLERDSIYRNFETRLRCKDGRTIWVLVSASVIELSGVECLMAIVRDVSEKKAAEERMAAATEALRESEIRYRSAFENNLDAYSISRLDNGMFVDINDAFMAVHGYQRDEVIGHTSFELDLWYSLDERRLLTNPLRDGATHVSLEARFRKKGGTVFWGRMSSSVIELDGVCCLCTSMRDISESRAAAEAVRASELRYRTAFESSFDAISLSRLDNGMLVAVNDTYVRTFGFERDEILGHTSEELGIWTDVEDRKRLVDRLRQESACRDIEVQFKRRNGERFWAVISTAKVELDGVQTLFSIVRDVSEEKAAEERLTDAREALRLSEERYRTAFQTSIDAIAINRMSDGMYVDVNEAFLRIFGHLREEVVGHTSLELGFWANPQDRRNVTYLLSRGGRCQNVEVTGRRKSGEEFWALLSMAKIELSGVACSLFVIRDISDAKAAEERLDVAAEALRLSEERYRTAFYTSLDAIAISSLEDGRYVDVNPAFLEIFGFEREEVIGHTSLKLGVWERYVDRKELIDGLRQNTVCRNLEVRYRRKNGEGFWGLLSASIIEVDGVPCNLGVIRDISAEKAADERLAQAAEALRHSEERYRTAFYTSLDGISITTLDEGRYIDVNPAFLRIWGYDNRVEVIGHTVKDLNCWVNSLERQRMIEKLRADGVCTDLVAQFRKKDGEIFWGLASGSVIDLDGMSCLLSCIRDITKAKLDEQQIASSAAALKHSEERYRTSFQTSLDGISITTLDEGRYVDVNPAFLRTFGYEWEELIGKTSMELNIWLNASDRERMAEALRRDSICQNIEAQLQRKNGESFWVVVSAALIELEGVACVLFIVRDISESKAAAEEIRNLAFYDPLTKLPNRRLLLDRIRHSLDASSRTGSKRALLFLDLDDFKLVNDTLGHQIGDLMLAEVAGRMLECVRKSDTVARLGGDEFVVMLEELGATSEEAAAHAKLVAEKILAAVRVPYQLAGHECRIDSSIGLTIFGNEIESTDDVLQQADIAMYKAKSSGAGTMRFFAPALQSAVNARAALEDDLRMAIREEQFTLYYQPQIAYGQPVGAEALIRWRHPARGMVAPDHFIPLSEETGQILPIGKWVLEAGCLQIAAWAREPATERLDLSVNISARQFRDPEFVEHVLDVVKRTGANPMRLKLEVTESALLENVEEVISKMTKLRAHGVGFSLDDFGTGYSSLSYLKRLPLDQLKIDRSFIRDLQTDAASGAIAQTIIALGHALKLTVIAEGVESEEQRAYLATLNCHAFQGFLFSPPVPLAAFEELLKLP